MTELLDSPFEALTYMSQLLDSPRVALTFNYVSYGIFTIVNSLWTWIAVIVAAVSFWRIRAAGAATLSCFKSLTKSRQLALSIVPKMRLGQSQNLKKSQPLQLWFQPPASVAETSVYSPSVCNNGAIKGGKFKLTVYYEDEEDTDVDSDGDGDSDFKEGSCWDWWESWERALMSVRKEETRCYLYQDLTALNGDVVRLWDQSCTEGRHSSSSVAW